MDRYMMKDSKTASAKLDNDLDAYFKSGVEKDDAADDDVPAAGGDADK